MANEQQSAGPQPSGPQPSGPQPSGPQPSGPQPSGPQPSGPQANTGGVAQLPTGPQQPIQMLNIAGPGQTFLPIQAYPQPAAPYYAGSPYLLPEYLPDRAELVAYPNFAQKQYLMMPQTSGPMFYPIGQQVIVRLMLANNFCTLDSLKLG